MECGSDNGRATGGGGGVATATASALSGASVSGGGLAAAGCRSNSVAAPGGRGGERTGDTVGVGSCGGNSSWRSYRRQCFAGGAPCGHILRRWLVGVDAKGRRDDGGATRDDGRDTGGTVATAMESALSGASAFGGGLAAAVCRSNTAAAQGGEGVEARQCRRYRELRRELRLAEVSAEVLLQGRPRRRILRR